MLNETCMLVRLTIGLPPLTRLAKRASEDVEVKYKTERRQAKVTKSLFAKNDIQPIQKAATAARRLFNDLSLPYDVGSRIIPTETYFEFVNQMAGESMKFDSLKHKFLENYHITLMRSESTLGSLWKETDYPTLRELEDRIYFSIESTVLPPVTAFDNLVGISEEEITELKQQAIKGQQEKVKEALRALFERLRSSLDKATIRLANKDAFFKDTLVSNIGAALEAVDSLNLTRDQKLIDLAQEVKDVMEGITPNELRKDEKLRLETAEETQKLVDKMGEFF